MARDVIRVLAYYSSTVASTTALAMYYSRPTLPFVRHVGLVLRVPSRDIVTRHTSLTSWAAQTLITSTRHIQDVPRSVQVCPVRAALHLSHLSPMSSSRVQLRECMQHHVLYSAAGHAAAVERLTDLFRFGELVNRRLY